MAASDGQTGCGGMSNWHSFSSISAVTKLGSYSSSGRRRSKSPRSRRWCMPARCACWVNEPRHLDLRPRSPSVFLRSARGELRWPLARSTQATASLPGTSRTTSSRRPGGQTLDVPWSRAQLWLRQGSETRLAPPSGYGGSQPRKPHCAPGSCTSTVLVAGRRSTGRGFPGTEQRGAESSGCGGRGSAGRGD